MKIYVFLALVTAFANLAPLAVGYTSGYMEEFCKTFDSTPIRVRTGRTPINHPQDVAVDPKGNILVLDGAGTKQASLISLSPGGVSKVLIEKGRMKNPRGITVQPKQLHVIIADEKQLWELRCAGTPTADQCPNYAPFAYPKLPGKTFDPLGLTADSQGTIFFVDNITHTLKMATEGNIMSDVIGPGQLVSPFDVELDPSSSDLYISDRGTGGVYVLECAVSDDGFCSKYEKIPAGLHRIPEFDGVVKHPTGIAVDFQANIFVADAYHGKIFRLDSRTRLVTEPLGPDVLASPNGLAVNLDTFDVLVADSRNNHLDPAALYRVPCSNIAMPCSNPNMDYVERGSCKETISETKCFYNCIDGFAPMGKPWVACLNGRFQMAGASCAKAPLPRYLAGPICTNYNLATTVVIPVPFNFVNPVDVIVDGDSNIFVLDHDLNSLYAIAATTGQARVVLNGMSLQAPLAMGLQPASGDLYITVSSTSTLFGSFSPILRLLCPKPHSGQGRRRIGCSQFNKFAEHRSIGTLDGNAICNTPGTCALTSITVDGGDNLFIADTQNHRVIRSGSTGTATVLLGKDKVPGLQAVQLAGYHAEGGSWDLYVADSTIGIGVLRCRTSSLTGCTTYKASIETVLPATTVAISMASLAFDSNRNLFIGDNNGNRVLKLPWLTAKKTFGTYVVIAQATRSAASKNPDAVGISVDPNNGAAYLADAALAAVPHSLHHQLLRIDCNNIEYHCKGIQNTDVKDVMPGVCAGTPVGRSCKVPGCRPGYNLRNKDFSDAKCTVTGWQIGRDLGCEEGSPVCKPLTALEVTNVQKGSCANTRFGSSCAVTCAAGFKLKDPKNNRVFCTTSGFWELSRGEVCVQMSTTTMKGAIMNPNSNTNGSGSVTRAGIVVLVIAVIAVVAAAVFAVICVLRIRKVNANSAATAKMKGNLLDQSDGEAFDAHEI